MSAFVLWVIATAAVTLAVIVWRDRRDARARQRLAAWREEQTLRRWLRRALTSPSTIAGHDMTARDQQRALLVTCLWLARPLTVRRPGGA